jgi:predicted dehydrogenase
VTAIDRDRSLALERPVAVGVVGCGVISEVYLRNAPRWGALRVAAVADLDAARARERGEQFGVPAVPVEALLADPAVELVLNLTVPKAHAEVALAAVAAGKAVYNEKPLAIDLADGRRLLEAAHERGVPVGCAPDTFLGGGLQTCRDLLDAGAIGEPVAAAAFMLTPGHERWHPNPDFFYQPGGGPLFDMGPYYLSALVNLLGPVRRVTGSARASFAERTITSEPRAGERIPVAVNTHHAAVLDFATGPIATLVTSFDGLRGDAPHLEVYGSAGTLSLPDPNTFGGPVRLKRAGATAWEEVPIGRPNTDNCRGLGPSDLAAALRTGRAPRASGELALHVLEVMHAVETASAEGRHVEIGSTVERPAAMAA